MAAARVPSRRASALVTRKRTGTWPPTRPPSAGVPRRERIEVRVTEAEKAELVGGLNDGQTLSDLLRVNALAAVRANGPQEALQRP